VMVLSWDFEYTDDTGRRFTTRTSQDLLEEVSYPIAMHEIINNRLRKNEPLVNNMFVQSEFRRPQLQKSGYVEIENTELVDNNALFGQTNPATVQPLQTVVSPVQNVVSPVQNVVQPVQNVVQPVQNVVQPVQNVVQPVQNVVQPVQNVVQPVQNVVQPVQNVVQPVQEITPSISLPSNLNAVADVSSLMQPFIASNVYHKGEVLSLKNGFGFIKFPPNNLFFHYSDVKGVDFNELQPGDKVEFMAGVKENGQGYATNIRLVE